MVGPPRLISLSPEGQKEIYDLRLPVIKIGRAEDNHLAFPKEKTISGHHCEIYREGKNFFIRDLGSTNGVYVNSRKVDIRAAGRGGRNQAGGQVFYFHPIRLISSIRSRRKVRRSWRSWQKARSPSKAFPWYSIGPRVSGRIRRRDLVSSGFR